ncbi:MAG: hypothetical protein F7C08_03965 [Desulfurococcales archaeon]|nr:hypothetical protein [Desulfurococcales archaeon]
MKLMVYRDGGDTQNSSSTVESDVKEFISNVLLGLSSNIIIIKENELLNYASRGIFHAIGIAIKLYKTYRKPVVISLLQDNLTGIVVMVGHSLVGGIKVCKIDLGMVVECNSIDTFISSMSGGGGR